MNPYDALPPKAFWRPAVAERAMLEIEEFWDPKFRVLPDEPVSTYGSCFAQHIGRALDERGFNWFKAERAPRLMRPETLARFGYDVFSSRTANIYTTTLLRQWAEWAFGVKPVPEEIWEAGGRFVDPFRPRIEPDGFASAEELRRARAEVLRAFRRSVTQASVFVFTLGLTERWLNAAEGHEYPMCPGTAGGTFDPRAHVFDNLRFAEAAEALGAALDLFRRANPKLRVILTVSPVPLTATASGKHVLVATTQSKSILRAVAGQLAEADPLVDYFPSYEIITSPVFRGAFFEPNLRGVTAEGVSFVMDSFFREQERKFGRVEPQARAAAGPGQEDLVCEEELLEAFGGRAR